MLFIVFSYSYECCVMHKIRICLYSWVKMQLVEMLPYICFPSISLMPHSHQRLFKVLTIAEYPPSFPVLTFSACSIKLFSSIHIPLPHLYTLPHVLFYSCSFPTYSLPPSSPIVVSMHEQSATSYEWMNKWITDLHVTPDISPGALTPLPDISTDASSRVDLYISDVSRDRIKWVIDVLKALQSPSG